MERQVPLFHEQIQHGLLGVEAVFRLVEDLVGVGLKDRCGDLLSPVGGQAVLDHGAGMGGGHNGVVDLIALKDQLTLAGLALLSHCLLYTSRCV